MLVYTAARMRGILYYNFPAFDAARDALIAMGHTVISPADLDREHGFDAMTLPADSDWNAIPAGFDLSACIRRDVDAVLRCDALVFLPGDWTESVGCKSEFAVARWAGKPVYQLSSDLAEMRKVIPQMTAGNENTDKCGYVIPGMLHLNRDPEESTDHRVLTEEAEALVKRLAEVCHLAKLPMFVAVRISGGEVAHELPPGQFMRGGPWERWRVQAEPGDADGHLIILGLENQFVNGGK